jgi:hypothetical protein
MRRFKSLFVGSIVSILMFTLMVPPVSAATITDLQTQLITVLEQQLAYLQTNLGAVSPATLVSSSGTTFARGAVVLTSGSVDVYSSTTTLAGTQPQGARGTIASAIQEFSGSSWYRVNFDSGVDGWVQASSLTVENVPKPVVPPASSPTPTPAPTPAATPSPTAPATSSANPTCTITADKTSVTSGELVLLSWKSTNAKTANIVPNIGSVKPTMATGETRSARPSKTTEYTMTVTNDGGKKGTCAVKIVVVPQTATPTCTITADKTAITSGDLVLLSWKSTNADTANIVPNIGSVKPTMATGETRSARPATTTTYTMTVTDKETNKKGSCAVTITVKAATPTCDVFKTYPTSVAPGGKTTLQWNTSNASNVSIDRNISTVAVDGSRQITMPTQPGNYTYTLTARGADNQSKTCKTTVVVAPALSCTLHADKTSIRSGESAKLTWKATSAEGKATINQGIGEVWPNKTTAFKTVAPRLTTIYTMTVTGANNTKASCARSISVSSTSGSSNTNTDSTGSTGSGSTGNTGPVSSPSPSSGSSNTGGTTGTQTSGSGGTQSGSTGSEPFGFDGASPGTGWMR